MSLALFRCATLLIIFSSDLFVCLSLDEKLFPHLKLYWREERRKWVCTALFVSHSGYVRVVAIGNKMSDKF